MQNSNHTIAILLSTYNGADWLKEFLQSLESQTIGGIEIIFRDDGSCDSTLTILEETKLPKFQCLCISERIGPSESYMHLLSHINEQYYVAFADQDDIWLSDKIKKSVLALEEHDADVMFSAVYLNKLTKVWPVGIGLISPIETCFENLAKGCTLVMTNSFLKRTLDFERPMVVMHDHWIYFLASHVGKVYFESTPLIHYRIHSENVVGHSKAFSFMRPKKLRTKFLTYVDRSSELLKISASLGNADSIDLIRIFDHKGVVSTLKASQRYRFRGSHLITLMLLFKLKSKWREIPTP